MRIIGNRSCKMWVGLLTASLCLVLSQCVILFPSALADSHGSGTRDISEVTWVQTSDVDFGGGVLDKVQVDGSGSGASLILGHSHTGEWIKKTPAISPSPRRGHALATVFGDDKVVLFGGWNDSDYLNDTWIYDLSEDSWTSVPSSGNEPPGRHSHAMAGVPDTDQVVLFGGSLASGYENVTWIFDVSDNAWRVQTTKDRPSARVYHATAEVPQEGSVVTDERVILFGGYDSLGYLADTWVFNTSREWESKLPILGPSARKGHEMATVSGTDKIILFGGNESGLIFLNDTWIYDVSDGIWTLMAPIADVPSERRGHGMGSILGSDEVLLFGPDNQTWIYGLGVNDWRLKVLPTSPSERYITHGITSIDGTDQLLLFGGGFLSTVWTNYNDTWVYDASSFFGTGTYTSSPFDTSTFPAFTGLEWVADTPPRTNIGFQVRTAGTYDDLMNEEFLGPDGTATTQYTTSGQSLCSCHTRDRFLQFRVQLSTFDAEYSPTIDEISITFLPIDTDNDGTADFDDLDDDGDGMPDSWENGYGFDPLDAIDSTFDSDGDGLSNLQEFSNDSEPFDGDTDDDGLGDGYELFISKTDPADYDTDGDGVSDGLAYIQSHGYTGSMTKLHGGDIGITFAWEDHVLQVKTNSDILDGDFDKAGRSLSFTVSGTDGTQGVTELDVPEDMCIPDKTTVLLDDVAIDYSLTSGASGCNIRIEYTHSTHDLVIDLGIADVGGGTGLLSNLYLIALIVSLIVIVVLSVVVARGRTGDEDLQVRELSPEQLSRILEKKRAEGKMSDETYEDIKSVLEKE